MLFSIARESKPPRSGGSVKGGKAGSEATLPLTRPSTVVHQPGDGKPAPS